MQASLQQLQRDAREPTAFVSPFRGLTFESDDERWADTRDSRVTEGDPAVARAGFEPRVATTSLVVEALLKLT